MHRDRLFQYCLDCPFYSDSYKLFYDFTLFCYLNKIQVEDWKNYVNIFLDKHRNGREMIGNLRLRLRAYIKYVAQCENVALSRYSEKRVMPTEENERKLLNDFERIAGDEI